MAYYEDLSDYTYLGSAFFRPGTKNVGWLALGHEFKKAEPTEDILNKLWNFCNVSVAKTRGVHECEFCSNEHSRRAKRNGENILLGTSEMRVFSKNGDIYAAPNLIFHYVEAHKYRPPDEFLRALDEGPAPPSQAYFERLRELGLKWNTVT